MKRALPTRPFATMALSLLFLFASCVKDNLADPEEEQTGPEEEVSSIEELQVPSGFEFSTQFEANLTINDPQNGVRYEIYADNERLFSGFIRNNSLQKTLSVPQTVRSLKLWRKTARTTEEFFVQVFANPVFDYQ